MFVKGRKTNLYGYVIKGREHPIEPVITTRQTRLSFVSFVYIVRDTGLERTTAVECGQRETVQRKICKKETEEPRSVVCYEELYLAISCREAGKLSYLVRMLKGSDDDYEDRKKQKAETGRDKKDTEEQW